MNFFKPIRFDPPQPPGRPPEWPIGVPRDVAALFEELAFEVIAKGFRHYSAQTIIEIIRWHRHIKEGNREFKCNDHWTATLSRWFMAKHPKHTGFFFTRVARKVLLPLRDEE